MSKISFPIRRRKINGHNLVYLDSASTTQKPQGVIDSIRDFYTNHNANIHRGIYTLSREATRLYESARDGVQKFINARARQEIIFSSGATESINLVVWTWGHGHIHRGDEILLTESEHHSNLVPWQILARKKRARLKFIPIDSNGRLKLSSLPSLITTKTKIVSLAHISNVLGVVNPIEGVIKLAHKKGAKVLIDGAQAGGHVSIDVGKLGCDFYVLSGHKMYGPTGVGVLYGKTELLESMPPYQSGGHMIRSVSYERASWNDLPWKFEAGTANIAGVIGLGAAVDFIQSIGFERITNHELRITAYALKRLQKIEGLHIYGPHETKDRIGVISFNIKNIPPHDLASLLDAQGVAIRTGHHCQQPLHKKLGIESSARISIGIYNTKTDIDQLIAGIRFSQDKLS